MRVAIVDDEYLAREGLRRLVERGGDEVVGEADSGPEAIEMVDRVRPDLLLLDIQMPGMDGFEVLANLTVTPTVVFVTAFDQHALRAFEVHALDYILKPVDPERFSDAVERARRVAGGGGKIDDRLAALLSDLERRDSLPDRILIKNEGRMYFVRCEDIEWVEAAGNYLRINARGKRHLLRETMSRFEKKMDQRQFLRIHRSTIVNLDEVAEIRSMVSGDYSVILNSGTQLKLSRSYREKLQQALDS